MALDGLEETEWNGKGTKVSQGRILLEDMRCDELRTRDSRDLEWYQRREGGESVREKKQI